MTNTMIPSSFRRSSSSSRGSLRRTNNASGCVWFLWTTALVLLCGWCPAGVVVSATPTTAFEYISSKCRGSGVQLSGDTTLSCNHNGALCVPGKDQYIMGFGMVTLPENTPTNVTIKTRLCKLHTWWGTNWVCKELGKVSHVDLCASASGYDSSSLLSLSPMEGQTCPDQGLYTFEFNAEIPDDEVHLGSGYKVHLEAKVGHKFTTCTAHYKAIDPSSRVVYSWLAPLVVVVGVVAAAAAVLVRRRRRVVCSVWTRNDPAVEPPNDDNEDNDDHYNEFGTMEMEPPHSHRRTDSPTSIIIIKEELPRNKSHDGENNSDDAAMDFVEFRDNHLA